jgi:hypothetical protein
VKGLYFRRRRRIVPGVNLNLSSRGLGVSAGPRGAKVSANTSGRSFLSLAFRGLGFRRRIR